LPAPTGSLNGRGRYISPSANLDDASGRPTFYKPTHRELRGGMTLEQFERYQAAWADEVGAYLVKVHETAAGGVLVLGRSYADLQLWQERAQPTLGELLIVQQEGHPLNEARSRFLALAAQRKRPLMLALGGAWTGLDLSLPGVPPDEDNVLTDLVIPLAPLGVNRSITQEHRRRRRGVLVDAMAALVVFRQGIGRLVRAEGIPTNRRLHFLDARMHDPQWNSMLGPIVRILRVYQRRIFV
jgi:CRISPR type IV-associated DEAD/DEAH-box helicase Csf4